MGFSGTVYTLYACVYMLWRPEAEVGCIPLRLSTLFSEAGALTEPGAPMSVKLVGQQDSGRH